MLKELLKKRNALLAQRRALLETATSEDRDFTEEENKQDRQWRDEIAALDLKIETAREIEEGEAASNDIQTALDSANSPQNAATTPRIVPDVNTGHSDQDERDIASFRFTDFYLQSINAAKGVSRISGIVAEMHQEAVKDAALIGQHIEGIGVPDLVLGGQNARFRNEMSATGSGGNAGGDLIPTELRSPIEILFDRMVLRGLGATVWTGLSGTVEVPEMIDDSTAVTEKGETAQADVLSPTTGKKTLTPHRLPVVGEFTLQLLRQGSIQVEQWLRGYLAERLQLRMEGGAINGDGVGDNVLGLLNTPGIGAVASVTIGGGGTAGVLDKATALEIQKGVEVANADFGSLGWLTNSRVKYHAKNQKIDAGSGIFLWGSGDNFMEEPTGVTNLVPNNLGVGSDRSALIWGNFSDLVLALWGGMDVIVNPYSKDSQGIIRITNTFFHDVEVLRANSFAASVDINAA